MIGTFSLLSSGTKLSVVVGGGLEMEGDSSFGCKRSVETGVKTDVLEDMG